MNKSRNLIIWLAIGGFTTAAMLPVYQDVALKGGVVSFASRRFDVFLVVAGLMLMGWALGFWTLLDNRSPIRRWITSALTGISRSPLWLRWFGAILLICLPAAIFLFPPLGHEHWGYLFRIWVLLLTGTLAATLISPNLSQPHNLFKWASWVLAAGALFTAARWLNQVTDYPFSLSWSEGNRFWDYSILFGSHRYLLDAGEVIQPAITAGRQFLWALPFLFPNLSIWFLRLWDALLWIVPGLVLGWTAVGRVGERWLSWRRVIFALWAFVFIAQGPIYAPVVVAAILTAWAVRWKSLPLAALMVMFAAYYAYISRWTWMYGPGLWAGMLALLDISDPGFRHGKWKSLIKPVILGLAGYIGAALLPDVIRWLQSGFQTAITPEFINLPGPSSLSAQQPLLWSRLLPNPTYPPGILLGILWAGLPVGVGLVWLAIRRIWKVNLWQTLGTLAVAGAFLGVGIVISTKIGGGSNLHNLDLFWITLVLIASRAVKAFWAADGGRVSAVIGRVILVVAMLSPLTYSLQYGQPLSLQPKEATREALADIQALITTYNPRGEILFIDQRQLLTFHLVEDVKLIPDYEKKVMMDMAMAGRESYFARFEEDLASQRFVLILSEVMRKGAQSGAEDNFAEENNAWVKWVSAPILKYYEPILTLNAYNIQLLVPRK